MGQTFKLKGPGAVVALVVIAAVVGLQYFSRRQSLQTQGITAIKIQLVADYTRYHLPELQKAAAGGTVDETRIKEIVGHVNPDNIDIVSVSARGHGGTCVARAQIRVAGAEPPDGRSVRYFKMQHSSLTGWRVVSDANPWNYYLAF